MHVKVREAVNALVGRKVIEALTGIGSFFTLEFSLNSEEKSNCRSSLWIRHAAWRLEQKDKLLLGYVFQENFRDGADEIVRRLNGLNVIRAECVGICNDLIITFENDYVLKTFAFFTAPGYSDYDSWWLFTPDDYVAKVGPNVLSEHR